MPGALKGRNDDFLLLGYVHLDAPEFQGFHHAAPHPERSFQGLGVPNGSDDVGRGKAGVVHRYRRTGTAHLGNVQEPLVVDGQCFCPSGPELVQEPQQVVVMDNVQVGVFPVFGGHLTVVQGYQDPGALHLGFPSLELQALQDFRVGSRALGFQFFPAVPSAPCFLFPYFAAFRPNPQPAAGSGCCAWHFLHCGIGWKSWCPESGRPKIRRTFPVFHLVT